MKDTVSLERDSRYFVSKAGSVFRRRGDIFKPLRGWINQNGYLTITLPDRKRYFVHRFVLEGFTPKKDWKRIVNHKDGDKLNNRLNNLEWCNHSHNLKEAYRGKQRKAKLNMEMAEEIRRFYRKARYSLSDIGREFGVTKATVHKIINNQIYKHE